MNTYHLYISVILKLGKIINIKIHIQKCEYIKYLHMLERVCQAQLKNLNVCLGDKKSIIHFYYYYYRRRARVEKSSLSAM